MRYCLNSLFFLVVVSVSAFGLESKLEVELANIVQKTSKSDTVDYNRLRLDGTFEDQRYDKFFGKLIIDNENIYNISEDKNQNDTEIYRGYISYIDDKYLLNIGKQRIPFGVGRVWNPIDIFNPIDSTAIESDKREGTESIRFEYALGDLSNLDTTISKDKYALRIKGYMDYADTALVVLKDNKNKTDIYGYEISGEFLETGIELRSEGGYKVLQNGKDHFETIVGVEYAFEKPLTILGEYRYRGYDNSNQVAIKGVYEITPLLNGSLLSIYDFEDKSSFTSFGFGYSLADDISVDIGGLFYRGNNFSEFGKFNDSCFVKLLLYF
ncbi:MAG: hypothetical protein U9Q04_01140 [Campylobacterota bacterium]|nr:hypothetical protein [Campylobacterota bacterium]